MYNKEYDLHEAPEVPNVIKQLNKKKRIVHNRSLTPTRQKSKPIVKSSVNGKQVTKQKKVTNKEVEFQSGNPTSADKF